MSLRWFKLRKRYREFLNGQKMVKMVTMQHLTISCTHFRKGYLLLKMHMSNMNGVCNSGTAGEVEDGKYSWLWSRGVIELYRMKIGPSADLVHADQVGIFG